VRDISEGVLSHKCGCASVVNGEVRVSQERSHERALKTNEAAR